jgi:hypothetical protein
MVCIAVRPNIPSLLKRVDDFIDPGLAPATGTAPEHTDQAASTTSTYPGAHFRRTGRGAGRGRELAMGAWGVLVATDESGLQLADGRVSRHLCGLATGEGNFYLGTS